MKTVFSLDRAEPIPSGSGQSPRRAVTRISEKVDSVLPSSEKPPLTVSPCTYAPYDPVKRPRSISLTPPFGRRVRRTISTTSSLSAYLSEQKARFLEDDGNGWTVAMGNEAGDLDSLASSIAFAWLLSTTDTKAIALIPTPREDFFLRAENLYALQLVGIKETFNELLCSEDLPKVKPHTNYALVDHNNLPPIYSLPGSQVTAIVDHHEDEGRYLDTASPRIIEPAGSCASLVTRAIMSHPTLQIPPELATLLLCAIVIDTHGLRRGGKAVDVDYQASAWLLPQAHVPPSESLFGETTEGPIDVPDHPWIQSLSGTLSAKKTSLSHLNTRDLLRRDYKEYLLDLSPRICGDTPCSIKAGLATVPLPLSSFFSPSPTAAVVATEEWIRERGLAILGVLTTYKSKQGKSKRELMWVVNENVCGPRLPQVLFEGLEGNEVLQVKMTRFERYGFSSHSKMDGYEGDGVGQGSVDEKESVDGQVRAVEASPFGVGLVARVYKQGNSAATRKQVAPILKRVLEVED